MDEIKTFKTYNFVTGAVDGTLAYDFSHPGLYREEEEVQIPDTSRRSRPARRSQEQQWIKEDAAVRTHEAVRSRIGVSPLSVAGVVVVVVLLTMMLLAQIQLTGISSEAAELEDQIAALELEHDKLTASYETIFNLKRVEDYAVNVLGMQKPSEDQIYYLTGVAAADKAVVVTKDSTDMFSFGLKDLMSSFKVWKDALSR